MPANKLPPSLWVYVLLSGVFMVLDTLLSFPTAASLASDRLCAALLGALAGSAFTAMLLCRLPAAWELTMLFVTGTLVMEIFSLPGKFAAMNLCHNATRYGVCGLLDIYFLLKILLATSQLILLCRKSTRSYLGKAILLKV